MIAFGRRFARALPLLVLAGFAGCRSEAPPRAKVTEADRCSEGIRYALEAQSRGDAIRAYLRACSGLFKNQKCRAALRHSSGSVWDDWLGSPISACAKAYCPTLGSEVAACKESRLEGPEAFDNAWMGLSHAILKRENELLGAASFMVVGRFFGALNTRMPPRRGKHAVSEKAVENCERSIERGLTMPTRQERFQAYYDGCASLYEDVCRDAFKKAAVTDLREQAAVALLGCRKAYCAWLSDPTPEACDGEFVPTHEAVARAWPLLNRKILEMDGKEYVPRLMTALARLEDE